MLRKYLALSFIVTTIPCIDLEFFLLNVIIGIQFLIHKNFYRYIFEKKFVSEMILLFCLNLTFEPNSDLG